MIKIYGIPFSRTMRCLWLLEELGLAYENIPIHFREAMYPKRHDDRGPSDLATIR